MSNLILNPIYFARYSYFSFVLAFKPNLDYASARKYLITSIKLEKLASAYHQVFKHDLFVLRDMFLLEGMCKGRSHYANVQNLYDHLCENNTKFVETEDIPF